MAELVKRSAHQTLKVVASAYDTVRPPAQGAVVLAYHRVGAGSGLELDLDTALFAEQMAALADRGDAVDLDEAVAGLGSGRTGSSVVVTFDDGTADFVANALPALVDSGVPATYYIATDFIETQTAFPGDGTPLSWEALAEAVSTGLVTVGSHTHRHVVMDKVTPAEARDELRAAKELIEDRLGVAADHFAYPKGVFGGEAVEGVVGEFHTTAALADGAVNTPDDWAPLRLDRIPVQASDGMRYFEAKVDGGMRLEGMMRQALNRVRYRAAQN